MMSNLRAKIDVVSDPDSKHAFISHVHEDEKKVDNLCAVLEAAGIQFWRDRNDLGPGDAWKAKIREAIRAGRSCSWPASRTAPSPRTSPT